MEKNNQQNILSIASRQSPIAVFLIVQNLLRQIIRQFWPILLVIILNYFNFQAKSSQVNGNPYLTKILFIIAGLSTLGSILAYFKFYYYIRDGEFIIEKGIFRKIKINIPFDRIQTINFEQNLIHQAFNVVRLEIDSAGSNQKEISLQAISRERAEAIRSFIMTEKAKSIQSTEVQLSNKEKDQPKDNLLMRLSPGDLLKIGVSQNHLKGLGIIIGFGFWILQSLEDFLPDFNQGENPVEYLEKELGLGMLISFWVYLIFALILFSVIISLILTVFRFFDLRFFRTSNGFKVVSGLFTKREESANINKIQLIKWGDSILKRLFRIFRLHLYQASSAQVNTRQSIHVPGCYIDQINQVRATYFPNEKQFSYTTHPISPKIIYRRVLYLGGIPALILVLWSVFNEAPYHIAWALVWVMLVYFVSFFSQKKWKFHISAEGILTEHGIFGTHFTLLKWYKIQSVSIQQNLYQQRKSLADLYFFTAAGSVHIPYIPKEKAILISNYVLYKVETDQRDWM